MFPIITKLAGDIYEDAQENINKFGWRDIPTYVLVREPDNPHDPNAIRVALFAHYYMGYIPKPIAEKVAPIMDAGKLLDVEFFKRNESTYSDVVGLTVRIVEVPSKKSIQAPKTNVGGCNVLAKNIITEDLYYENDEKRQRIDSGKIK